MSPPRLRGRGNGNGESRCNENEILSRIGVVTVTSELGEITAPARERT
jgi:hypothetical protein